jgi:hypothetical protein
MKPRACPVGIHTGSYKMEKFEDEDATGLPGGVFTLAALLLSD